MSTYIHPYQFDQFEDEIDLVIEFDYVPAERMQPNPDLGGFGPGCPEGVEISSVEFKFGEILIDAWNYLGEDLIDEFALAALEDYKQGEE